MKPVFCFVALSLTLFSCKKGKTLSHDVSVQLIALTSSDVYPEGNFSYMSPTNPDVPSYYIPNYAHEYTPEEIADQFNENLTSCLGKNNIFLQSDSAEYVLVITDMDLEENLHSESYTDSCSANYPTNYVHYSSLEFAIEAKLYKSGMLLATFSEVGKSRETVRSKRDECNAPKIRGAFRGTRSLVIQVSKELRVRVSKKLYELEG